MNLQKHVIIINGVNKTYQVESIRLDGYKYAVKFQNANKVYSYSGDKVIWLTNPLSVEFKGCHVFVNGKKEKNIKAISLFANNGSKYYAITYSKILLSTILKVKWIYAVHAFQTKQRIFLTMYGNARE